MFSKSKLVLGSIVLAVLGFSPMFLSVIGKGNKRDGIKLNPNYYSNQSESLFIQSKEK